MAATFKRTVRPATAQEKSRHAEIRRKVNDEFPPAKAVEKPQRPNTKS